MEILSINFALFVVKLAFCIIPIALAIRLFTLPHETKEETRKKIASKLLGDSSLIKQNFFNYALFCLAIILSVFGIIVSLILFLF